MPDLALFRQLFQANAGSEPTKTTSASQIPRTCIHSYIKMNCRQAHLYASINITKVRNEYLQKHLETCGIKKESNLEHYLYIRLCWYSARYELIIAKNVNFYIFLMHTTSCCLVQHVSFSLRRRRY
jgi:hypothetical protein